MNKQLSEQTTTSTNLNWNLILVLAALGLLRPLSSVFGLNNLVAGPWIPLVVTALIAALWIAAVVKQRTSNPFATLVITGGMHGVFIIVFQRVMWTLMPQAAVSIPVIGYVSIIVTNLIWGAILGLIAVGIQKSHRSKA